VCCEKHRAEKRKEQKTYPPPSHFDFSACSRDHRSVGPYYIEEKRREEKRREEKRREKKRREGVRSVIIFS
jgi:hypothetical protein